MAKTKLESYESIILNHHCAEIELILDKTYKYDKLIMINLSPTLVERENISLKSSPMFDSILPNGRIKVLKINSINHLS
jgi:hypothetical protein